jgi:hypothetical protein
MVLDTPLGNVLADYLLLLARSLSELRPEDLSRLKGALSAMVGACAAPSPDRMATAADQIDLGRLEQVRRVARQYLAHRPWRQICSAAAWACRDRSCIGCWTARAV